MLMNSTPEHNGQTVNQSKKLEINQTVDHVGHSEQLKPCLTDGALPRKTKAESQLKIYSHAVDSHAEMDAMEDILQEPGDIGLQQDLLQEDCIKIRNTAELTV